VPPSFAPTHAWVCPQWSWHNARHTVPGATVFDGARVERFAGTTVLYVANSRSTPIGIHVDCYTSDGVLERAVVVATDVAPLTRFEASLLPFRAPVVDARGDFDERGEGWFHLWATGPVTPAANFETILHTQHAWDTPRPVVPVEIEVLAEAAPPRPPTTTLAEAEAVEANLSRAETLDWLEGVAAGRRFERRRPPSSGSV
jgi:hypothetical protein